MSRNGDCNLPDDKIPPDCNCIDCENRRRNEANWQRSAEDRAKHSSEEGEKFAKAWNLDWAPILTVLSEKTGLSRSETMAFMTMQQVHGMRLALYRLIQGSEAMGEWARRQHDGPDEEWKQP